MTPSTIFKVWGPVLTTEFLFQQQFTESLRDLSSRSWRYDYKELDVFLVEGLSMDVTKCLPYILYSYTEYPSILYTPYTNT